MTYDPLTAAQDGMFTALSAAGLPGGIYQHVPENAQPPMNILGDISVEGSGGKDSGLDIVTVEVASLYRGTSRRGLFAQMREVREAVEGVALDGAGAELGSPVFLNAVAGQPVDGTTYEGIQRFQIFAQPE